MADYSLPLSRIPDYGRAVPLERADADLPGAFVVRIHQSVPGAIALPDGGHAVAYGDACTHMACTLHDRRARGSGGILTQYRAAGADQPQELLCGPCPAHGTTFDLGRRGLVVLGPATEHLPQLALALDSAGTTLSADTWLQGDPRSDRWPEAT